MIEINSIQLDELPVSNFTKIDSRASRTATLDGTCEVSPYVISDSDRIFTIETKITRTLWRAFEDMLYRDTSFYCLCSEGLFEGLIKGIDMSNGTLKFDFYVTERIA